MLTAAIRATGIMYPPACLLYHELIHLTIILYQIINILYFQAIMLKNKS